MMASLIALAGIEDKPLDIVNTAMVRAKMCEGLATSLGRADTAAFFTVGLFSTLDVLLDAPLDEVLQALPLTDDVKGALLQREGAMGEVLRCAMAYERGRWDAVGCLHLEPVVIANAYLQAVAWADAHQGLRDTASNGRDTERNVGGSSGADFAEIGSLSGTV